MSKNLIVFNSLTDKVNLNFDPEKRFVKFTQIKSNGTIEDLVYSGFQVKANVINVDIVENDKPIFRLINSSNNSNINKIDFNHFISLGVKKIELFCKTIKVPKIGDSKLLFPIEIEYELFERHETTIPDIGFTQHLEDSRNVKILFSAKFGQGKSTFLEYYFKQKSEKYNVFKLFPVNYSVAQNDDIFKYIKCEIIYQLLCLPVKFDKEELRYSETFLQFFKSNAHKIVAPFLHLTELVGVNTYDIFDKLDLIKEEYFKFHENQKIDDKLKANDYLIQFFEKEGSLFEYNFYTQLIRQLLEKLKSLDNNKENVLIIDDLDRMDPDHIFRILNVFSAHYDVFHQSKNVEYNKFGFDRIILVCDYENLKNIYEHRYGKKVDFGGYINKYYSTQKFDYNNSLVVQKIISNIDNYLDGHPIINRKDYIFFKILTNALFKANLISLRDIFKLQSIQLKSAIQKTSEIRGHSNSWLSSCEITPTIYLLSKLGSWSTLIENLKSLKEVNFDRRKEFNNYSNLLLVCLENESKDTYIISAKRIELEPLCISVNDSDGFLNIVEASSKTNKFKPQFEFEEFIDLICRFTSKLSTLIEN